MIVIAGRSDRPTARHWERRVLAAAWLLALAALASGLVVVGAQTALFEGRTSAALDLRAIGRVLLETQAGHVWLVRAGFLAILAAFLSVRVSVERRVDWRAARGETVLLGAAALVPLAAAGHAAAVEPDTARAIALDGLHVLAAGVWVGGLVPLALLLKAAAADAGADARPYAVLAARRFSRAALCVIVLLAATGTWLATMHVGNVAGLVGTSYGRLLLAKLALLTAALGFAALNRSVLLARLGGDGPSVGRPAMRRLSGFVVVEAILALAILAIVATMSVTPPARHEPPTWPFTIRLSFTALEGRAAEATRALIGSQIGLIGLVVLIAGLAVRAWRLPLATAALAFLGIGAGLALPPLTIDAYPTTYLRPTVPYQAGAITAGAAHYQASCAGCHGPRGAGDGLDGRGLPQGARRSARAAYRPAHRGRSLLVDQPRDPRLGHAGIRLAARRRAALGADQLPQGAVGRLRRPGHGAGRRARSSLARGAGLPVRGGPDAPAQRSRTCGANSCSSSSTPCPARAPA